jgi:hypothetical protein
MLRWRKAAPRLEKGAFRHTPASGPGIDFI